MRRMFFTFILINLLNTIYAQDARAIIDMAINRLDIVSISARLLELETNRNVDIYSKISDTHRTTLFIKYSNKVVTKRILLDQKEYSTNKLYTYDADNGLEVFTAREYDLLEMAVNIDELFVPFNIDALYSSYNLLAEEVFDDKLCYVVELVPGRLVPKAILWIDKNDGVIYKKEYYDGPRLFRTFEIIETNIVQEKISPKIFKIITHKQNANIETVFEILVLRYNDSIPDGVFSVRFLKEGK